MRIAIVYTKLHNRLLRPLTAANQPPAPLPLRQALRTIDNHIDTYIAQAHFEPYPTQPDQHPRHIGG